MVSLWSNTVNGGQESDRKSSWPFDLWLYLAGLLVVGSIATYLILRMKNRTRRKNRTRKKNSSLNSDENAIKAKKEPLVDKSSRRHSEPDIVESLSAVECQVTQKERRKSKKSSRSKSKSRRSRGLRTKSDSKQPWMSFATIETRSDSKEPTGEHVSA